MGNLENLFSPLLIASSRSGSETSVFFIESSTTVVAVLLDLTVVFFLLTFLFGWCALLFLDLVDFECLLE